MKKLILLLLVFVTILSGCDFIQSIQSSEPASKTTTHPPLILKEYFIAGTFIYPQVVQLNKVQQWMYSSSHQIIFKSINPPYVVNVGIRNKTSQIANELEVRVYQKGDPYKISDIPITASDGRQGFVIKEKGDYVIDVHSVGYEWWAMVGSETEGIRE